MDTKYGSAIVLLTALWSNSKHALGSLLIVKEIECNENTILKGICHACLDLLYHIQIPYDSIGFLDF